MEQLVSVIQSLGFPVACVIALGYFISKIYTDQQEESKNRESRLYDEIDKCREINNKAIATIHECVLKLGLIQDDITEIKDDIKDLKNKEG